MISNVIKKPINVALLFIATLFGCTSTSPTAEASSQLSSHSWILHQLNGEAAPKGEKGKPAFIQFDAEQQKVSGNTGCNNFFGSYTIQAQTLSISPIGMTRMFCSKSADLESNFSQMLAKVSAFRINENQLSLLDADGVVIAILKK